MEAKIAASPAPTSSAAANRAHNSRRHKKEQQQQQQQNSPVKDAKDPRKVHITGFPPYTQPQDIMRVFSKFGNVKIDRITSKFAYLAYPTEEEAKAALDASKKVNIYGEFLTVKPYSNKQVAEGNKPQTPKREFPRSKQKGIIVDPFELDLSGDFHLQLDVVLASVRLTQDQATAVSALYGDVQRALQAAWPGCVAMPFGSITTGLGIKTSDADCYVHVPPQFHTPTANFIAKAKKILLAYPQTFDEIFTIPRANTPLIKFFHIPTETNCDLSFKTPLGHQNSKLISFLLQTDPRLLPMAVAIKYWAKVHGLSGTGKLSNYALTMMIIFYLQQPPMSILPSVEWLQRDPSNDCIVDQWNTGFITQRDLLPYCSNTSSIAELLGGFFEYYSMFNFEEMAVCPFMGYPIKKDLFKDMSQLPAPFDRYKQNVTKNLVMPMRFTTPLCVEDPFELCHNVASAVSGRMAAEIKAFIKFAANTYEKEKLNKCKDFLKTILLQKPKIVRAKNHPEFRVNLFPRMITNIIKSDWKSVVREVIFTIFEKMLKLQLGKVEEKLNTESKKEKEKYMGILTKSVWKRKQCSRKFEMISNMNLQEKQAKITDEIVNTDKTIYNIQFQMTVTYAHNPKSAVVAIKLSEGEVEAFKDFGKFFISVMQYWFMTLVKPYTKPLEIDMAAKIAETIKYLDSNLDVNNHVDSDDDDEMDDQSSKKVAADSGNDVDIKNDKGSNPAKAQVDIEQNAIVALDMH